MGVKVATARKAKSKATPKKNSTPAKKKAPSKKVIAKTKPETRTNNTTPKPKAAKPVRSPKKKAAKKPTANNTPVKKEINDSVPANSVPEKKESRKRAAPKAENDVPAKRASPAKKRSVRGRPPVKANNVISPKKKEPVAKKTLEKPTENTPAKATNNVGKKQSKAKPAKKSPATGKKPAVAKTPKKSVSNEKKAEGSAKATKAKATGGKRAKRGPAAKTKSVYMQPVIELDPLEHFKALHQVSLYNFSVIIPRLPTNSSRTQANTNPVVRLRRIDFSSEQGKKETNSQQNDYEASSSTGGNHNADEAIDYEPEERSPLNTKYHDRMEKIKGLNEEKISEFVKNSRELCEKLRGVKSTGKNDVKELYKCYPFNSSQQLAMYFTLREMFNVPQTHFKECRNFFTVIMPELSNRLFAQTFGVKVTSAPRLIKKLYPNPTSPF